MGRLIDVERVLEPYKILRNTDTLCVATIRQNILECPTVEAIPKDQYEARLRDDLKAILVELQLQMEEYEPKWVENDEQAVASCRTWEDLDGIIQNKINTLEE